MRVYPVRDGRFAIALTRDEFEELGEELSACQDRGPYMDELFEEMLEAV